MSKNGATLFRYLDSTNLTAINDADESRMHLTTDDEFWLVHCPKNINIMHLKDQKIKLPGKSSYENIESLSEELLAYKQVPLAAARNNVYCLPIRGNILIREKFKNVKVEPIEELNSKNGVAFPQDLKKRHPLLGADYQEKLILKKSILKRLQCNKNSKNLIKLSDNVKIEFSNDANDITSLKVKKEKNKKYKRRELEGVGNKVNEASTKKEKQITADLETDAANVPDALPSGSLSSEMIAIKTSSTDVKLNVQPSVSTTIKEQTATDRKYDVVNFLGKKLDDVTKLDVLENVWTPNSSASFDFPYTTKNNKKRKFRYDWLHQFKWLCYTPKVDGAFCKMCVLFAPTQAGISSQQLGALSKKPYHNWKSALEDFREHETMTYHCNAVCSSNEFVQFMKGKQVSVDLLLDAEKRKQIQENRRKLIPIIEAVILCGRQELPLRGHRDSGKVNIDLSEETENKRNFRAILAYRARGDDDLKDMLQEPGERNKYISSGIQNDIINACNKVILEDVVLRVNNSKAFSILADKTADIAGIEQLSIGVKYYDREIKIIREDFLKFIPITDLTGQGLASTIISELKILGIDMQYLRGQGYDGASSMSGYLNGVQAIIGQNYKMAPYVHCMGHVFNLVVSNACGVPAIRNALATVQESLKRLSQTRWIERFHAVEDFVELFDPVLDSLTVIKDWSDRVTSREAGAFINSLLSGEFLVALIVAQHLLSYGLPLSKFLQKTDIELMSALDHAENLITVFENMRSSAITEFKKLFEKVHDMADKYGAEIRLPRLVGRQCYGENPQVNNPEEYYRITLFIPVLDAFLTTLKEKFTSHRNLFAGFSNLIPTSIERFNNCTDSLDQLIKFYEEDGILRGKATTQGELELWHQTLKSEFKKHNTPLPVSAIEGLMRCDESFFPNICRLLQLLGILPVSTATSERSFSTLKHLKTYLRNTIGQNRLNGLAVLSVHRSHEIDLQRVLDNLARQKNRRAQI